jgi:HEPN domain-containing protein
MGRPHEFFRRGVQYYVMARQAVRSGYPQVAGSLFHQAFEMLLKASLLEPLYDRSVRVGGRTTLRRSDRLR